MVRGKSPSTRGKSPKTAALSKSPGKTPVRKTGAKTPIRARTSNNAASQSQASGGVAARRTMTMKIQSPASGSAGERGDGTNTVERQKSKTKSMKKELQQPKKKMNRSRMKMKTITIGGDELLNISMPTPRSTSAFVSWASVPALKFVDGPSSLQRAAVPKSSAPVTTSATQSKIGTVQLTPRKGLHHHEILHHDHAAGATGNKRPGPSRTESKQDGGTPLLKRIASWFSRDLLPAADDHESEDEHHMFDLRKGHQASSSKLMAPKLELQRVDSPLSSILADLQEVKKPTQRKPLILIDGPNVMRWQPFMNMMSTSSASRGHAPSSGASKKVLGAAASSCRAGPPPLPSSHPQNPGESTQLQLVISEARNVFGRDCPIEVCLYRPTVEFLRKKGDAFIETLIKNNMVIFVPGGVNVDDFIFSALRDCVPGTDGLGQRWLEDYGGLQHHAHAMKSMPPDVVSLNVNAKVISNDRYSEYFQRVRSPALKAGLKETLVPFTIQKTGRGTKAILNCAPSIGR